jgi:hypothetical protein
VGVGSAVNRSLTGPASRAGQGVEIVVGLEDDPEHGAARLVRRTAAPLLVGLEVGGSALVSRAPKRTPDLFAGAPVLLGVKLRPEGGDLWVRGSLPDGHAWEQKLRVDATEPGTGRTAAVSLFGRELVEDLELACAAGRPENDLRLEIERVGLAFGISTRFTSWVAVTEDTTVDPSDPSRRVRMPHELPHGASIEGIGLRGAPVLSAFLGAAQAAPMMMSRSLAKRGAPELVGFKGGMFDPSTRLVGKVRVAKLRELVIEITIEHDGTDWQPGSRARVFWREGATRVEATVVIERTTRPGPVLIGQTVRLWLRFDSDLPAGSPLRIMLYDGVTGPRSFDIMIVG